MNHLSVSTSAEPSCIDDSAPSAISGGARSPRITVAAVRRTALVRSRTPAYGCVTSARKRGLVGDLQAQFASELEHLATLAAETLSASACDGMAAPELAITAATGAVLLESRQLHHCPCACAGACISRQPDLITSEIQHFRVLAWEKLTSVGHQTRGVRP